VLAGQVGGVALDVVAGAARERWAGQRDLTDALETLGVQALLASAEQDQALDRVEDEVFRFSRIVSGDADLSRALGDWRADHRARTALAQRLLGTQTHPVTLALVLQAVRSPRGRRLDATLADDLELAAARRQRLVAVVTAAVLLTSAQQERLAASLRRLYGRQVLVEVDVDPRVVGGLRVAVGDEVLDATVLTRLSEAERRLTGSR
jgi:F-type H+-transporting ATPase subunit delta